jgi:uncharacterized membrane-anchored protein YhcB (DUF1043 family)
VLSRLPLSLLALTFDPKIDLGQIVMIGTTIVGVIVAFAIMREQVRQLRSVVSELKTDMRTSFAAVTTRYDEQQKVITTIVGHVQNTVGILDEMRSHRRADRGGD